MTGAATNEAAERLRKWITNGVMAPGDVDPQTMLTDALAAERSLAGQCDGYAGDAGASAPRCESYAGHPGRHFIRFDGTTHEAEVCRTTVERIRAELEEAYGPLADVMKKADTILDKVAARV